MSRRERQEDGEQEDHDLDTAHAYAMRSGPSAAAAASSAQQPLTARMSHILQVAQPMIDEEDDDETYDSSYDDDDDGATDDASYEHGEEDDESAVPLPGTIGARYRDVEQRLTTRPPLADDARTFANFYTSDRLGMYREEWRTRQRRVPVLARDYSRYDAWPYVWGIRSRDPNGPGTVVGLWPGSTRHEELVYMQWAESQLPHVDYAEARRQPWQEVEEFVRFDKNSVDWGRSLDALHTIGNVLVSGAAELDTMGKQEDYDTADMFNVPAYKDSLAVSIRHLRALYNRVLDTPVLTGAEYDGSGGGYVFPLDPSSSNLTPLNRVLLRKPFNVNDEYEDNAALSGRSLNQTPNATCSYETYISSVLPIEDLRHACISAINGALISGLMETAILYGPSMAMTLRGLDLGATSPAYTFMRYWYGGTVGLNDFLRERYETENVDVLISYRRRSNMLLADNWRKNRLLLLDNMYRYNLDSDRAEAYFSRMERNAPAQRLSKRARALFICLVPAKWQTHLRRLLALMRTSLDADHYRPVAFVDQLSEHGDVVFRSADRAQDAHECTVTGEYYVPQICALVSLQAAVATYGSTPPINVEYMMRQVFGDDIYSAPQEYIAAVKEATVGVTVHDDWTTHVSTYEGVSLVPDPQRRSTELQDAFREVTSLLTLHGAGRSYDPATGRGYDETYAEIMYSLMFDPDPSIARTPQGTRADVHRIFQMT